jgi:chemotaxis response regulator CheB
LFAQGVCEILERESDIELLGPRAIAGDAVAHIEAFDPDVVVIAEEDPSDADLVVQILRVRPDLPLVRVGLEENAVRVHRIAQVAATSTSLLDAIRRLPAQMSRGTSHE